jgi:hypothetical protein
MGRTFIRQDAQIRQSVTYTDSTAPSLANYETNPTNIETDLNNLRSQIQNFLNRNGASMPSGNWYDNITQPTTLENGTIRGIDSLNDALHLVEKKRVLRDVTNVGTDVTVPTEVDATGVLTFNSNVNNLDTVTTGTKTYTFQTVLTDVDGNVLIGATASDSIDNLIAAITLGAGSGTLYAASTTANGFITAAAGAGDTMDATALLGGTDGNTIATTESTATVRMQWGAATLTGGAGDMVILALSELPSQTTAAIGAVTTLGTVGAYNSDFGNIALDEVAGPHALNPKNLMAIVDADSGDPLLSSGRQIWGLFQTESNTDGSTMTGTTPNRAQISFVRPNSTFDDLEICPATDIAGQDVQYTTRERVRLEDLNEADFLRGAVVDIGSGSGTVTRQVAYDNQGTTAVNLTTNATLDLEGPGLVWSIRDDLEATLFSVTEGSAGGTSKVSVEDDVDEFDVDAAVNDFLNGASFDTGAAGTTINVGVTANQIDAGAALTVKAGGSGDLNLDGNGGEVLLDDINFTNEATWSQAGVKVTETTTEISTYESNFGGEVSLFNAINQAYSRSARVKGYAVVTSATVAANTDVDNTTSGHLDADLPDYSGVGTFVDDVDVYLNGELLRNGANAAANHDVYPGSTPAQGMLKFEFALHGSPGNADQLCMIVWSS